jgi:tRNA dimethylallyltransferase
MLRLIAIIGPTGAGKSTLALRVAARFDGEIVNCDSLQLYRGFSVGAAKIPESQRAGIRHHMIDVLDPGEVCSAGDYARGARQSIAEISRRGHLPILAGGTGFYLRALLDGLPSLPGRDETLRQRLAARGERQSSLPDSPNVPKHPFPLHRMLTRLDPAAAARIHPHDTQKLIRALEVRILTRKPAPVAGNGTEPGTALDGYVTLKIGLNPDRALLYQTLDARAREMFRSGAARQGGAGPCPADLEGSIEPGRDLIGPGGLIQEVQNLLASGCTGHEKPFESLGYRQALEHLRGNLSIEDAIASTQLETRQYAKRQWTWFRRDADIIWLDGFGNSTEVIEKAMEFVQQRLYP